MRSMTGATSTGSGTAISSPAQLRLEQSPEVAPVFARELRRLELAGEAVDDLAREVELGLLHVGRLDRFGNLGLRVHVLGEEQCLENQCLVPRSHEAEALTTRTDETPERCGSRLPHRLEQQDIRSALRCGCVRDEEVRPIEIDRVDGVALHEAGDLDRPGVVLSLDRLQIGVLDDQELPFRDLVPADDLLLRHLAVVHRAPPLLLDGSSALSMEESEGHIRLPGSRFRRGREPDGDRYEAEAEGAVPGCAHVQAEL